MKIRKFFAGSSRDALRMVREALGPDAVVLSNRAIDGGVELVALAENDLASLAHLSEHAAPRTSTPQPMRPQPRTSEEVRPYNDTRQPATYPNRALPDPFASTFGAPAAIADQQAYAHAAQATRTLSFVKAPQKTLSIRRPSIWRLAVTFWSIRQIPQRSFARPCPMSGLMG